MAVEIANQMIGIQFIVLRISIKTTIIDKGTLTNDNDDNDAENIKQSIHSIIEVIIPKYIKKQ